VFISGESLLTTFALTAATDALIGLARVNDLGIIPLAMWTFHHVFLSLFLCKLNTCVELKRVSENSSNHHIVVLLQKGRVVFHEQNGNGVHLVRLE
jgi:hypothetical protein